jgi:hypothetical protein
LLAGKTFVLDTFLVVALLVTLLEVLLTFVVFFEVLAGVELECSFDVGVLRGDGIDVVLDEVLTVG